MSTRKLEERKIGADLDKLPIKQKLFVQHLLADEGFNFATAAKKAGYKNPSVEANRLIKKRAIRCAVGKAIAERTARNELDADNVLKHLAAALYLDPLDLFDIDSTTGGYVVKELKKIPPAVRRCITKIKQRTRIINGEPYTDFELELMSKDACMTNALKHLGLVSPDNNTTNVMVTEDFVSQMLDKVEEERQVIDTEVIEHEASK